MSDHVRAALTTIVEGGTLSLDEARLAMGAVMDGEATPAQLAALLMGLRMRGETVDELAGFATAMRERVVRVDAPEGTVDVVGTGGDGSGTFNISTAAALVVAAAGVPVAKHGNRAITSKAGSADVLDALGIRIDHDAASAGAALRETGFAFLFAPELPPGDAPRRTRPARRSASAPRSTCSGRSRTRPARAGSCWASGTRPPAGRFAEVVHRLGTERTLVVHGAGVDELPLDGTGVLYEVTDDGVERADPSTRRPWACARPPPPGWPAATPPRTPATSRRSCAASPARGATSCCSTPQRRCIAAGVVDVARGRHRPGGPDDRRRADGRPARPAPRRARAHEAAAVAADGGPGRLIRSHALTASTRTGAAATRRNVVEEIAERRRADLAADARTRGRPGRGPGAATGRRAPGGARACTSSPRSSARRRRPGGSPARRGHRRPGPRVRGRWRRGHLRPLRAALVRRLDRRPAPRPGGRRDPGAGQGVRRRRAPAGRSCAPPARTSCSCWPSSIRRGAWPGSSSGPARSAWSRSSRPTTSASCGRALATDARLIGINNRDLRTLDVDTARADRLRALVPDDRIVIAESGVRDVATVARWRALGFDGALVGEALMRSTDAVAAARSFVAAGRQPDGPGERRSAAVREDLRRDRAPAAHGGRPRRCRRDRAQRRGGHAPRAGPRRGGRARPGDPRGRRARARARGSWRSPPTPSADLIADLVAAVDPDAIQYNGSGVGYRRWPRAPRPAWKALHVPATADAVGRDPVISTRARVPRRRCRTTPPRHRRRAAPRRHRRARRRGCGRGDRPGGAGHPGRRPVPGQRRRRPCARSRRSASTWRPGSRRHGSPASGRARTRSRSPCS